MDFGAVATRFGVAPSNKRSIFKDGSKCRICGLKLLHLPELTLDSGAVTATIWTAPRNDRTISQDRGKCGCCSPNLFYSLELMLDFGAVTTSAGSPQVTTDPFSRIAANARFVPQICPTPLS